MTVGSAIWRDQLTEPSGRCSAAGHGDIADPRPDVLVVGGGILGVATAAACHEAGLGSVLLIETGRLGAGATGGATGLLIPEPHQWSDPEPSWTWSGPAWSAGGISSRRCRAASGWSSSTGSAWRPHPGGFAAHQPPAVEWLTPGQVGRSFPAWPGPWRAR